MAEWVSCSKAEFGVVGELRHLAVPGSISTLCGNTATYADIWRKDSRKEKCKTCLPMEKSVD